MKLNQLVQELEQANHIETKMETKGYIFDYYKLYPNIPNLPYDLTEYWPQLIEKTVFNVMQDSRRGFWINKVWSEQESDENLVLIQFMFNREGDDHIDTFIINKELLLNNINVELLDNWMDEDEIAYFINSLNQVSHYFELSDRCLEAIHSWLEKYTNYKKLKEK